eukprot:SAG31_NODE_45797_length_257_cov_0.696203_1_plen_55_part_10
MYILRIQQRTLASAAVVPLCSMALNAGQSAPPLIPVVSKRLRTPLVASMCDPLLF